jgi:hypothetical protein
VGHNFFGNDASVIDLTGYPQYQSSQERDLFGLHNVYPTGQSRLQSRIPGSFDFDDENYFDPPEHSVPSQSISVYDAPISGALNASLLSMGPPNTGFSTTGMSKGYYSGCMTTINGISLPGFNSANGFTGYSGGVSPMASLGNRLKTLTSGVYAALQTWRDNSNSYPAASSQAPTVVYPPDTINITNDIDPLSADLGSYCEDLHDDPRKTAEEIKDLLANIQPDEEIPEEDRIGSPEQLRYALYAHQQLALQWMMNSEEGKNRGGILADDVGRSHILMLLIHAWLQSQIVPLVR